VDIVLKIVFPTSHNAKKHHEMISLTPNFIPLVKIIRVLIVDRVILVISWYFIATFDVGTYKRDPQIHTTHSAGQAYQIMPTDACNQHDFS